MLGQISLLLRLSLSTFSVRHENLKCKNRRCFMTLKDTLCCSKFECWLYYCNLAISLNDKLPATITTAIYICTLSVTNQV